MARGVSGRGHRRTHHEQPMYSPKIPERLIPALYRLGQERRRPMTHLVAEAVERYLAAEGRFLPPPDTAVPGGDEP
jgi:hypothetical protein